MGISATSPSFAKHFGISPDRLGPEDIRTYQLHLLHQQASKSIFYPDRVCPPLTLRNPPWAVRGMVEYISLPPRSRKTLPVILSRDEVKAFACWAPRHLKHRVILATLYATGVRVSETLSAPRH